MLTLDPKKMKPLREMAARRALNRSSTSRSDTALSTPLLVGTTVKAFTVTCTTNLRLPEIVKEARRLWNLSSRHLHALLTLSSFLAGICAGLDHNIEPDMSDKDLVVRTE